MSIQYKSIKELKNMLNNKDISHTELIQETFLNIKNNSALNAFITLNEEESLKKANNLDNIAQFRFISWNTNCSKRPFLYKRS